MSNFKVGQKVVYIGGCINPEMTPPNKNDIVEICGIYNKRAEYYRLSGFEFSSLTGGEQWYSSKSLRPLDHQFAEDVIAMITELETVNV